MSDRHVAVQHLGIKLGFLIRTITISCRSSRQSGKSADIIGDKDFSGTKGELQFRDGELKGDTDGDHHANFTIKVDVDRLGESDLLF